MAGISWQAGDAYEAYVGRWSRQVARLFVAWLGPSAASGPRWLDVGCGTGALTGQLPSSGLVVGVDSSAGFLAAVPPSRVTRCAGDAAALPLASGRFDVVVSGLALNFVRPPEAAVAEFCRVAAPGATVAAYVWDYAGGMAMMQHFWAAAGELDPELGERDESLGYGFCRAEVLAGWWSAAGLREVATRRLEIPMVFRDFDDYWRPFLGAQGPAPSYLATRSPAQRDALRSSIRQRLPIQADGSIPLTAAAHAVRGRKP
ncbi:SAM-dependent methyltransferase [Actinoplanes octamycinicus]|uniref:SAM-dependent methyltransferase n=1 Tax=Actinoplanes octamycinicus TaxID=135948 RepID=A0A7W7GQY5_9ACTN|nr:class I SAM-dependent methyltransferase [Actinoplanes octamycinicus]MBB4736664.1 SAM-dependent methyltransferase [Actinoplanes octamycinicus]GIE63130.1 methyltransferase [Actinoplanes octamycinicus]